MIVSEYKVTKTFKAPKIQPNKETGKLEFMMLNEGDVIRGILQDAKGGKVATSPIVITTDGFVIVKEYTEKIKDLYDDADKTRVSKENLNVKTLDDIKKIANKSLSKEIFNATRYSVNGMLIGASIGLIWAFVKGRPMFLPVILGGVGGGLLGKVISKKAPKVEEKAKDVEAEIGDEAKKLKERLAKRKAKQESES